MLKVRQPSCFVTRFHLSPAETEPWRRPRHFTTGNLPHQATPPLKTEGLPQAGSESSLQTERNDVTRYALQAGTDDVSIQNSHYHP